MTLRSVILLPPCRVSASLSSLLHSSWRSLLALLVYVADHILLLHMIKLLPRTDSARGGSHHSVFVPWDDGVMFLQGLSLAVVCLQWLLLVMCSHRVSCMLKRLGIICPVSRDVSQSWLFRLWSTVLTAVWKTFVKWLCFSYTESYHNVCWIQVWNPFIGHMGQFHRYQGKLNSERGCILVIKERLTYLLLLFVHWLNEILFFECPVFDTSFTQSLIIHPFIIFIQSQL